MKPKRKICLSCPHCLESSEAPFYYCQKRMDEIIAAEKPFTVYMNEYQVRSKIFKPNFEVPDSCPFILEITLLQKN